MKRLDLAGNLFVIPLLIFGLITISGLTALAWVKVILSLAYAIFVMAVFDLFARKARRVLMARAVGFAIFCGVMLYAFTLVFSNNVPH